MPRDDSRETQAMEPQVEHDTHPAPRAAVITLPPSRRGPAAPKPVMPTETYLLPSEAAASLRVSVKTLTQWRWQGKGPPYLRVAGGHIRYVQRDLETWMAAQAVRPVVEVDTHARATVHTLPPRRTPGRRDG